MKQIKEKPTKCAIRIRGAQMDLVTRNTPKTTDKETLIRRRSGWGEKKAHLQSSQCEFAAPKRILSKETDQTQLPSRPSFEGEADGKKKQTHKVRNKNSRRPNTFGQIQKNQNNC